MASKTKRKTEILAVKYPNGSVVAETEYDRNLLKSLAIGQTVKIIPLSNNRNYQHHKKFFALLGCGFEYWQPQFDVITQAEKWIAENIAKRFAKYSQNPTAYHDFCKPIVDEVLAEIEKTRQNKLDYEGLKTLEAYLNHTMIKAGFFDIRPLATGGCMKERWSIAFDSLPQEKFNEVYKGVYGVIWNETLCNVYESEWALDNKINQLMGFF